jgi:hypothetical protein
MRKSVFILPFAVAIALAGCSKKEEAPTGGEGGGAKAAGGTAAVIPDAGLYQTKVELLEFSIPGMPAGMGEQMKKSMSSAMAHENCLTEGDRVDAVKKMTKGAENGSCKYTKYDINGGKIDAQMDCDMGSGAKAGYRMTGTISTTGVDMTMEGEQSDPRMKGGATKMKMHLTSTRVGECKA